MNKEVRSLTKVSMYLTLNWILGFCYGFVVMSSPAKAMEMQVFQPGLAWRYQLHSTVLMNEKDGTNQKDVGFYIAAKVNVESIWAGSNNEKLLRIKVENPKLHIRSRKVPTPEGFIEHSSKLDNLMNEPYYVLWNRGKIEKILLRNDEPLSLANLKKGIASLFQFQMLDQEITETDASGKCKASYVSTSPSIMIKTKTSCTSDDLQLIHNPKPILKTQVESTRVTSYEFSDNHIQSVIAKESHIMTIAAREEAGNVVDIKQEMTFIDEQQTSTMQGGSFDVIYQKIRDEGGAFTTESLLTEPENVIYEDSKTFTEAVEASRETLKSKLLGTLPSARSFINLVNIARKSSKDDIVESLNTNANKNILCQIFDILGFVQTTQSHEAAMTKLKFTDKNQLDFNERYLWALSIYSSPNAEIIKDLLEIYKTTPNIKDKLKETLILSIASMGYHLKKISDKEEDLMLLQEIETIILDNLETSKNEARYQYLRAIKNLRSPTTIPVLLQIARNGTYKENVMAWKALKAMELEHITPEVLKVAEKTFLQIEKRQDTSARTLALDIILASHPSDDTLRIILYYLLSKDTAREVKQYTLEQIKMLAGDDLEFQEQLYRVIGKDSVINNYSIFGQSGFSVAFTRKFLGGPSSNGSLLTVQEMQPGGIVKRGIVNVVMDKNGISQDIFSLGIFTAGLSSIFSNDDPDATDTGESATAGMELSVLGTQIRPFTFFTGQGDLMGHVWSGTASDRTTAFQALYLLHYHQQYLRLGSGFVAELDLNGAASFDISGQATYSLWHRTAEGYVEKSAGILVIGVMRVDSTFIRSQVDFSVSVEPKLSLLTNVDFYSGVKLCLRLTQPESIFKHNIYKIERIPGSKHRLRIAQSKKYPVAGKSYSLNKKNSDMCNIIFN